MKTLKRKYDNATTFIKQTLMKMPGIFGAPQPHQVVRGSIGQPVHSRLSRDTVASKHVKIIPAFAYNPKRKKLSQTDHERSYSAQNRATALKAIRNQPATFSGGNLS